MPHHPHSRPQIIIIQDTRFLMQVLFSRMSSARRYYYYSSGSTENALLADIVIMIKSHAESKADNR